MTVGTAAPSNFNLILDLNIQIWISDSIFLYSESIGPFGSSFLFQLIMQLLHWNEVAKTLKEKSILTVTENLQYESLLKQGSVTVLKISNQLNWFMYLLSDGMFEIDASCN